jgi:5-methylcytosine-specific restriction protein A
MRLTTLKPRLASQRSRLDTLTIRPDATPRRRGREWMEVRAAWLRANPLCCDCRAEGRIVAGQEVDHVTPLWQGGADDESNFATRCIEHHKAKTAREARDRNDQR